MRALVVVLLVAMAVMATAGAAAAYEKELVAYDAATAKICERGVTPDVQAKYDALVAALDKAKYGFGHTASPSNFWGPTGPQALYEQCRQAGGDGGGSGGGSSD